jgi:hypothetical protein
VLVLSPIVCRCAVRADPCGKTSRLTICSANRRAQAATEAR